MSRLAAMALMIGLLTGTFVVLVPTAQAAEVSMDLYGSAIQGWGLSAGSESMPGPPLTVQAGDTVTITLHSTDGASHEFFIDLNGNGRPDSGEPTSIPFTDTTTVTFVAASAGTFTYYCSFHPSTMNGSFVVGPGAGGPASTPAGGLDSTVLVGVVAALVAVAGVAILVLRRK